MSDKFMLQEYINAYGHIENDGELVVEDEYLSIMKENENGIGYLKVKKCDYGKTNYCESAP